MRPKGMENLAEFSAREESSSRGKRETSIPLQDSGSQRGKVIPASFLKVEGRWMLTGAKDSGERDR